MIGVDFTKLTRPTFTSVPAIAATPAPLKGKALRRRMVAFREASEFLPHLPEAEGDATHALMNGRYDLMILIVAALEKIGEQCQHLRIATLSFNARNIGEISNLLRSGRVDRVTLLASEFFRDHSKAEWAEALREAGCFPDRWAIAAARSHAKVACLHLAGGKMVWEGSANLRTNSNMEQLTIIRDAALHDWHSQWLDNMVVKHGTQGRTEAGE